MPAGDASQAYAYMVEGQRAWQAFLFADDCRRQWPGRAAAAAVALLATL